MKRCISNIVCLCMLLAMSLPAGGQEVKAVDGFMGRGIAKISGGDMQGARQSALADAQFKAILDAVFSLLPADVAAAHSTRIMRHFAAKPERYLQSFRITGENALPDQYQVTLQAAVQLDAVRQELAGLGLVKQSEDKAVALLVMAADRVPDAPADTFWWSLTADTAASGFPLQQALESAFADKGTRIISPFEPSLKDLFKEVGLAAEPAVEPVCRLAAQAGAQMVVLVRATLARSQGQATASVQNAQCDMTARAIDVRRHEVVAQAVTHGLGQHVDEAAAFQEARQKAAGQLADQITERLYQQLRQAREYELRLRFNKAVSDADANDCITAFKQVLPGLDLVELVAGDGKEHWTARVTSPAEDVGALQKMFGSGPPGYVTRITSAHDNVLEMRITPIKKR